MDNTDISAKSQWLSFLLLTILICLCYSNTLNSSWQLDDNPVIVANKNLHIQSLSWAEIKPTLFSSQSSDQSGNSLYRPIPCFTFSLNWFIDGQNVIGYHIVNIAIHILNAIVLFLLLLELFKSPRVKNNFSSNDILFVALLSVSLWAINPVQTQAVTYIVQRMASMAALFSFLCIRSYLVARNKRTPIASSYIPPILFFLAALLCKENTIVLPLLIIIIEIIFYDRHLLFFRNRPYFFIFLLSVIILIVVIAPLILKQDILELIANLYANRSFTAIERVLTEFRILIFYLSLIFYPVPQRLSIAHEIPLSTSILTPQTTLISIVLIFALCIFAIVYRRKYPFLSLAILFFFFAHLIESTVLPLELIFEHRNYLPSIFLFVPASIFIKTILNNHPNKIAFQFIIKITIVLLLVTLSISTYIRNGTWRTQETLWVDAAKKYPANARVLNQLANAIAWNETTEKRDPDLAISLLEKALTLPPPRLSFKSDILGNIGSIYFNYGHYSEAISYYRKALDEYSHHTKVRFDLVKALALSGNFEDATLETDIILKAHNGNPAYHLTKGILLLHQNDPNNALKSFIEALHLGKNSHQIFTLGAKAYSMLGDYKKSDLLLMFALDTQNDYIPARILLVENALLGGNQKKAEYHLTLILNTVQLPIMLKQIKNQNNPTRIPFDTSLIFSFTSNYISNQLTHF